MMSSANDPLKSEQDYNLALELKIKGNEAFKTGNFKEALKNYTRIFMHIGMNPSMNMAQMMSGQPPDQQMPSHDDEKKKNVDPITAKTDQLRLTAFNNISAVYAKMGDWEKSKEKSSKVLKHDANNIKALFRRGMAYRKQGLYDLAKKDLDSAKKLLKGKKDLAIERELKLLQKDVKTADKEFMNKMKKRMLKAQKKKKEAKKKQQKQKKNEKKEQQINKNQEKQKKETEKIDNDNNNNNDKNDKNDTNDNNDNNDKDEDNDIIMKSNIDKNEVNQPEKE